ncbi:hypothetical protein ACIBQX_11660 [Nonomuraea sp. NPDC049714]|uniref:hypothetical protein n=1 Tax=Nonomuraea sp. NPDC049714 TaxID=3364357 RepID=UPI0037B16E79
MPDQTVEAGPVLRLPEDLMRVTEIVAAEFKDHEDHVRDRTLAQAAETLRARARVVRTTARVPDELVEALTGCCHAVGGLIYADPRVVAEVAYEAVAGLLAGHDRMTSDASGAIRNTSERSETEASNGGA